MPYIDAKARRDLDPQIARLDPQYLSTGELNYLITNILLKTEPQRYEDFNKLIGLLECVKLELYRRAVAPYEDKKCEEQGDVY